MTAVNPAKDWSWDKEVQSRILAKLDEIACMFANYHKKKGAKTAERADQFQPDYVKEAKEEAEKRKKDVAKAKYNAEEMQKIKNFWQQRNGKIRML